MMECPFCGCKSFYVKDPDDEYGTYEFDLKEDEAVFTEDVEESEAPEIRDATETYCNKCAWHGKFQELKKDKVELITNVV